jgi:hypothetical protein
MTGLMAYSGICSVKRLILLLKVFVQQLAIVQCTFLLNFVVGNKPLQNFTCSLSLLLHGRTNYEQVEHVSAIREYFLVHITEIGSFQS